MRALLAALAIAATALTPAVAQAPVPSTFDLFRRVCVDTGADMARAVASPDLRGWTSMPFPFPTRIENGRIIDKAIRVKSAGKDNVSILVVSRGEFNARGKKIPFLNCTLAVKPAELGPTQRRVEAWLGFAPMALPKGAIGYHWTERAGVRTPLRVAKMSDMPPPPAGSRVAAVDLKFEKGTLVVSYTLPRL